MQLKVKHMKDISLILETLTLEEKAALVSGHSFMYTNPIPQKDIPSIRMSDGPHGLRVQQAGGDNGVTGSEAATCFPTAGCVASSWNPSNSFKLGQAIASEAKYYGINVILGPGANIKRNPLGGRNFEYYSEDPFLSGKMAAGEIKGIESKGIAACLKHFALNNQENYRFMGDSIADIRAINEIYLKAFEIAIKEGEPETVMCSYNKINGTYACENKWLLTEILRNSFGFDGLVMTDWGATHDRIKMLQAGLDLEMPGDTNICRKWIIDGIKNGQLKESDLDNAVRNVLTLVKNHENQEKEEKPFENNIKTALEIALDSAVLMKNDGTLPLKKDKKYLVVGELFEKMRYQGAGSSMINPYHLITPKMAFDNANVSYLYCKGYKENEEEPNNALLDEIKNNAKDFDTVLAFIGLTDYVESEGGDRLNMSLPKNQLAMIEELRKLNKKIVLVFYGGSPVELPFINDVSALLNMYLPGQEGGEATRQLLFGEANPSGKLPETWPIFYSDVPYSQSYSKEEREIYKESIFVGYRYYQKVKKNVVFPFGYGLSYTKFKYSDLEINESEKDITVTFNLTNVGNYYGGEITQIYLSSPKTKIFKEENSLKAFEKVYLEPNETKQLSLTINKEDIGYFSIRKNRFIKEEGEYTIKVCSSSDKVELEEEIHLDGEKENSEYTLEIIEAYEKDPANISDIQFEMMSRLKIPSKKKKTPITLESRFSDLEETFMGRILYNAVLGVAKKDMKKAKKLPDGIERDNKIKGALFLKRIVESNSIVTMSMSAGSSMPYHFAKGFVDLANGHIIKGIKDFLSPVKVTPLPIDLYNKEQKR